MLTEVAARLRSALRPGDFVGRFGGDEFVIVVPNVDDAIHALNLADRLFANVVGPAYLGGSSVTISLSMGVSLSDGTLGADELLQRADQAMYQSKRDGRGRLTLYSETNADLISRDRDDESHSIMIS